MSDIQKSTVERILKEQKKTKRELANFLRIKENSINRTLKNPNISIRKLEKVAEFLGIEVQELLFFEKSVGEESNKVFRSANMKENENQVTISNLSEALNRSSKTIESLVKIIADGNLVGNSN